MMSFDSLEIVDENLIAHIREMAIKNDCQAHMIKSLQAEIMLYLQENSKKNARIELLQGQIVKHLSTIEHLKRETETY